MKLWTYSYIPKLRAGIWKLGILFIIFNQLKTNSHTKKEIELKRGNISIFYIYE